MRNLLVPCRVPPVLRVVVRRNVAQGRRTPLARHAWRRLQQRTRTGLSNPNQLYSYVYRRRGCTRLGGIAATARPPRLARRPPTRLLLGDPMPPLVGQQSAPYRASAPYLVSGFFGASVATGTSGGRFRLVRGLRTETGESVRTAGGVSAKQPSRAVASRLAADPARGRTWGLCGLRLRRSRSTGWAPSTGLLLLGWLSVSEFRIFRRSCYVVDSWWLMAGASLF